MKENFEDLKVRVCRDLVTMSDREWKKEFDCTKLDELTRLENYSVLKDDLTVIELKLIHLIRCCDDYTIGTLFYLTNLVEKKLSLLKEEKQFSTAVDNDKQ